MNIAFLSSLNPYDIRHWLGSLYYLFGALCKHNQVTWLSGDLVNGGYWHHRFLGKDENFYPENYNGGTNTVTYSTLSPGQFKGYQSNDSKGCLNRCDEMLSEAGMSRSGGQILMTNKQGDGRTGTATSQAQDSVSAINSSLAAGNPIVVCVDYKNGTSSDDQQGDHFIVITGSFEKTNGGTNDYTVTSVRTNK